MKRKISFSFPANSEFPDLKYGVCDSSLGKVFLAFRGDQIFSLYFANGKEGAKLLENDWPGLVLKEDNESAKEIVGKIFNGDDVNISLVGSDLQKKVWKVLCEIKPGNKLSYSEFAKMVGKPDATRAVATCIAKNKVAYLIPCHRVIKKSGKVGNYRFGSKKKEELLKLESSVEA